MDADLERPVGSPSVGDERSREEAGQGWDDVLSWPVGGARGLICGIIRHGCGPGFRFGSLSMSWASLGDMMKMAGPEYPRIRKRCFISLVTMNGIAPPAVGDVVAWGSVMTS
jgi:hypothetical protein